MRRTPRIILAAFAASIGPLLVAAALVAADEPPASKGQPMPGPFQAWTVNGSRPGKYHCPVCERGLRPGVLVLSRSLPAPTDPLAQLLAGLEKLVADRKDARLGAAAIFPVLKDEIQLDEERAPVLEKAESLVKDAGLMAVAVGLARKDAPELAEYDIPADAFAVVLLFDRLTVVDRIAFAEPPTAEQIEDVLKKTTAMLPPPPVGKKKPVVTDK